MTRVVFADERTKPYGTGNCRRMRQHIFTELSPIAGYLANRYVKTAERSSFEQVNLELQDIYNQLRIEDLNLCAAKEELLSVAKRFAKKCIGHGIAQKLHPMAIKPVCVSSITTKSNGHPLKATTWNRL